MTYSEVSLNYILTGTHWVSKRAESVTVSLQDYLTTRHQEHEGWRSVTGQTVNSWRGNCCVKEVGLGWAGQRNFDPCAVKAVGQ